MHLSPNALPSAPGFRVQHQGDNVAIVAFDEPVGPLGLAFDLVIFHGGSYVESCAAWRLRGTQPALSLDAIASA